MVKAGLLLRDKRGVERRWLRRGFWLSFKMAREEDEDGEQNEVCIFFSRWGFGVEVEEEEAGGNG